MDNELPASRSLSTIVSWVALFVALGCLGFIAWYIPADRRVFMTMLRDFKMELPGSTELMLAIPDAAFAAGAAILACALVGVQWYTRAKGGAALVHMLAIVFCCITLVAYRESLFQPLTSIIRAASGR